MYHLIKDEVYYLYSDDGLELMSIRLTDMPGDQLVITTASEVYSGPVQLVSFSEDVKDER